MTIRHMPKIWLSAGASIAVSLVALGGHAAATPVAGGGPIEMEFPDCFGPYSVGLEGVGPNVIIAQPFPAITWGTGGDDVIIGTDASDHIYALGGNDRICAGGGNDHVEGGLDIVSGPDDVDHIDGGSGSDILHGGHDRDFIFGGSNFSPAGEYETHDYLYGEAGDDFLWGEGGPDLLSGGWGDDFCDGGTGMAGNRAENDGADAYCNSLYNIERILT